MFKNPDDYEYEEAYKLAPTPDGAYVPTSLLSVSDKHGILFTVLSEGTLIYIAALSLCSWTYLSYLLYRH